jgi:hypothetical protein
VEVSLVRPFHFDEASPFPHAVGMGNGAQRRAHVALRVGTPHRIKGQRKQRMLQNDAALPTLKPNLVNPRA